MVTQNSEQSQAKHHTRTTVDLGSIQGISGKCKTLPKSDAELNPLMSPFFSTVRWKLKKVQNLLRIKIFIAVTVAHHS